MRRHFAALALLLVSSVVSPVVVARAADYQCREANGCTAQISQNGRLETVQFRKGDIICSEDGWIGIVYYSPPGQPPAPWEKLKTAPPKPKPGGTSATFFAHSTLPYFKSEPLKLYKGMGWCERWDGSIVWMQTQPKTQTQPATWIASPYYKPIPHAGTWNELGPNAVLQ